MFAVHDLVSLSQILGAALAVASVVAIIWAVLTDSRRKRVIEAQESLYELKKEELAVERDARAREHAECQRQIHELNGRVSALESTWIQQVAEGVAIGVIEHLEGRDARQRTRTSSYNKPQDRRDQEEGE